MNVEPRVAGPQAAPAVVSEPTPTVSPPVLDANQRGLLRSILNQIIPPHDDLPGAGDLDVGSSIERTLSESPRLRRLFLDGLLQIELTAHRQSAAPFVDAEPAQQIAVLEDVERTHPAFFVALVEHTYRGYYVLPNVHQAIGWAAHPPQPLGFDLPVFDPAILEQQRARAPFWRRTS